MAWVRTLAVVVVGAAVLGRAWGDEELRVGQGQVERLELAFTLAELTGRVAELFSVDRPLYLERRWRVIGDYYGFMATKRELALLRQRRDNLRALWQLAKEQAEQALVDDAEQLRAHNVYIESELALVRTEAACRERLLDILECCVVEVATDGTQEEAAAAGP